MTQCKIACELPKSVSEELLDTDSELIRIERDGHCLVTALRTVLSSEHKVNISSAELRRQIHTEVVENGAVYANFLTEDDVLAEGSSNSNQLLARDKFLAEIDDLLVKGVFNNNSSDIIIAVLCNVLNIELVILQETVTGQSLEIRHAPSNESADSVKQKLTVRLLRSTSVPEHYDAIVHAQAQLCNETYKPNRPVEAIKRKKVQCNIQDMFQVGKRSKAQAATSTDSMFSDASQSHQYTNAEMSISQSTNVHVSSDHTDDLISSQSTNVHASSQSTNAQTCSQSKKNHNISSQSANAQASSPTNVQAPCKSTTVQTCSTSQSTNVQICSKSTNVHRLATNLDSFSQSKNCGTSTQLNSLVSLLTSAESSHSSDRLTNETVKDDLGKDRPAQPVIKVYPVTLFGAIKRRFQSAWFKNYMWLEYSPKADACFCFPCRRFKKSSDSRTARDMDPSFVLKGFRNWKAALESGRGFAQHETSKYHIEAMLNWNEYRVRCTADATIEMKLCSEQLEKNRFYVKSIAEVVQFLALNELGFRGDSETCIYDETCSDDVNVDGLFLRLFEYTLKKDEKLRKVASSMPKNAQYKCPNIQNEIIDTMGAIVQSKVVNEVINSDFGQFCLKCDETRDRSNVENLSIVLRFVKDGVPKEHLLALVELGDVNARGISTSILDELRRHGVEPCNMLSQCYDGANVMSGAKGGVQKIISEELGRCVPYVHCYNHRLHLVVVHSMQKESKARNFFSICEQLYVFLRRQLPSSIYEGSTIKRLLEQRWSGHLESAEIVVNNREDILAALETVAESEKAISQLSVEAAGLKTKVAQSSFSVTGIIIIKILSILQPANAMMQGKSCNMLDATKLVTSSIASLGKLRNDLAFSDILLKAGVHESVVSEDSACKDSNSNTVECRSKRQTIQSKLLRNCEVFTTLGHDSHSSKQTPYEELKRMFFSLLDNVIGELEARFNSNNGELVTAIASLAASSPTFMDKITLRPLIELVGVNMEETECELRVGKPFILKTAIGKNLQATCEEIVKFKDAFPNLCKIYCAAITIGISTASCESSFSTLSRILRPHRQSMTHSRKAALVILAYEKKLTASIDMDEVVRAFAKRTRRIQL